MQYFAKARAFRATVRKFESKSISVKGTELARREAIILTLDVPVQPSMLEHLPKTAQAFLSGGPREDESEKMKLAQRYSHAIVLNIHTIEDNKKSEEPVISKGGNDDGVTLEVLNFHFVGEMAFARVKITCRKCKKIWNWGYGVGGDAEVYIATKPSQETFDFVAAEEADEEENEGDEVKAARKKKEKPAVTGHSEVFDGLNEIKDEGPEGNELRKKSKEAAPAPAASDVPEGDKIAAAVTKRKPYQRKLAGDPVHTPINK